MKTCDAKTMMPGLALVVMGLCCSAYADSDCENSAAFTIDNATVQFADVIGRVVEDSGGNPPVAGATVVLSPGGHVTTTLGDGTLEFQDVPIATGYGLEIVAEGYESVTISPVDVLLGVNDLGDILLTPLTGTFSLQPLSPAIHDGASQVEEGCLAYRYFRVVRDDTDQPQGGVRIRVRPVGGSFVDQATYAVQAGYAGATPGLSDGGSGAVRLCIPASEVGGSGSAQTFETVLPDESSGPSFEVSVVSRRYEHGWSQQAGKGINVGVNVVGEGTLGVEQGYLGSIARQSGGEGDPEQVSNGSSTRLTFEVGVGAPVGG
ncbi:MAG: carboxypeptidase regulatory-like domain-containing protein, partial [Phycisphaerae bacterium]|nr:carboxypeptidase regulatory-like domain-containing protein [Phycisphaerae bacterium]